MLISFKLFQIDFMRVAPQENNVGDTAEVSEKDDVIDDVDGRGDLGQVWLLSYKSKTYNVQIQGCFSFMSPTHRKGRTLQSFHPPKKDSRTLWFFSRILKMVNWSVLLEVWVKQMKRRFWNITTGLYLVTTVSSIWLIAMSLLPFQVVVYKVLWKLDMNLEAFAARLCLIGLHFYVV